MKKALAPNSTKHQTYTDNSTTPLDGYTSRIDEIQSTLLSGGILPTDMGSVVTTLENGRLLRFATNSKPRSKNGWIIAFFDRGLPYSVVAGDWATGVEVKWIAGQRQGLKPSEVYEAHIRSYKALEYRRAEQERNWQVAALKAASAWSRGKPACPDHPYLKRKGVKPFSARQLGQSLVLLLTDPQSKAWSLQTITEGGEKRLMAGGRKAGCYIYVNGPIQPSQVLICEGFATGCTLAEQRPYALVMAAVDAGNLKAVALSVRLQWPEAELVICGDDDRKSPGNPGLVAARNAAVAARALLALPEWPETAPQDLSDFNDLANWQKGCV